MIRPDSYTQSESPGADHQFGSYKDETSVGANDGTGLFKDQVMDLFQPWANLFTKHSITPSNVKEKQSVSQVTEALDAELNLTAGNVDTLDANGTYTVDFDNKNGVLLLEAPLTAVTISPGAGVNEGNRLLVQNNTGGSVTVTAGVAIVLTDNERVALFYNTHLAAYVTTLGNNILFGTLKNLSTIDASDKDTASIVTEGGIAAEKKIHAGDTIKCDSSNDSTNKDSGAIVAVNGGIGAEKNIVAGLGITAADALTEKIYLRNDGKIALGGETSPDCFAGGMTLKLKTGFTNALILTCKVTDSTHTLTTVLETDTFWSRTSGPGLNEIAINNSTTIAYKREAYTTTEDTTASVNTFGNQHLICGQYTGTTVQAISATGAMVTFANIVGGTKHIFRGNGDIYTDSDQTAGLAGTYDNQDDILLLKAINNKMNKKTDEISEKIYKKANELGIINENGFRSHDKSWLLNMGAILQLWNIIRFSLKKLGFNEKELLEFAKNYS